MNTPRQRATSALIIGIIGLLCIGCSGLFALVCGTHGCQ